uniref:Phlebovirus_G2 domain-containing protein n=1 Tax=Haemonchus contortus TaxID=6289 RepID=A0A7I4YBT1_HAECO
MCYFIKFTARSVWLLCRKLLFHRRRLDQRYDVQEFLNTPLLTVISVILLSSLTLSCQDIDVFFYRDSICTFGLNGVKRCTLETTEIMKLNTFNQEACIRLRNRQAMEKEIRIQWRGLHLTCVKETIVFTRNTFQKVVDSKRCAHVGSCVDDKCASINTSSLLPELVQGNQFPGMTMCVESCGGIGCGCLALSSGCLFYRIFHVPQDEKIYEIFKCSQWKEEVELEITTISKRTETINKRLVRVQPTVPINYNKMRITLTSLSFPPTPMLASSFISDGSQMALWNHKETPQLLCDSEEHARLLNCTVTTNCRCEPAENKVTCVCTDFNLTRVFTKEIENRFPIRRPWITFATEEHDAASVVARIPSFTTTELLIHLKEEFDNTIKMVTDSICTVPNSIAKGCYHCPQGASAEVTCTTNGNQTMATVICEEQSFTIPCQGTGSTSTLRFTHSSARVKKNCTVSCGTTETAFEITGVLQWVRTIHGSAMKVINSESNVYDELIFPDFGHIFDVILHWYKTVIIVLIILALALVLGYILLWSCGFTIIAQIGRMMLKLAGGIVFMILLVIKFAWKLIFVRFWKPSKGPDKLL